MVCLQSGIKMFALGQNQFLSLFIAKWVSEDLKGLRVGNPGYCF